MIKKIKSIFSFPADIAYEKEIIRNIRDEYYKIQMFVAIMIISFQIAMLISALVRPMPPVATKRLIYIGLYSTLILATVFFVFWLSAFNSSQKSTSAINISYAFIICLWSCGISLLDMYRASNISVFSYVTMAVAVFCLLTPWQSLIVFSTGFLVINSFTFIFSENTFFFVSPPSMFGLIVNSGFVSAFAFAISVILYRYRVFSYYNRILLKTQYAEICQINKALETLSKTDQLTEMGNRRFLIENLEKIANEQIEDILITGMMIDIDFFKSYNDFYGHQKGDVCLKEIAKELISFSQDENAFVARYGGEEFFLYTVNTSDGVSLAEKLRAHIQNKNILREDIVPNFITVSIGVSTEYHLGKVGIDEFIRQCDRALYQAKGSGRNCVYSYSQSF